MSTVNNINNDTICAVSTPRGVGGIAVIRVSGPSALDIVSRLWTGKNLSLVPTHSAHLGNINYADGGMLDQAVATVFRSPGSYTGEDIVELSVHGSIYVQRALVQELCKVGARLAEPGEFTRRAFVAGKIDLTQAEAVADILSARTQTAHRLAVTHLRGGVSKEIGILRDKLLEISALLELELDFSEEDVEFADRSKLIRLMEQVVAKVESLRDSYTTGSAIKDGIPIAIVGATNAGKSSLLNALVGDDRAIVSNIHGTTRDIVEDTIILSGHTFRLMDTAGIRDTADAVEQLGIDRSRDALTRSHIVLLVLSPDTTVPPTLLQAIPHTAHLIVIQNKADQTPGLEPRNNDKYLPDTKNQSKLDCPSGNSMATLTDYWTNYCGNNIKPMATLTLSAKTGQGIDILKTALTDYADTLTHTDGELLISGLRQQQQLTEALTHAHSTLAALRDNLDTVITAQSLRSTLAALSTLTGQITTPAILSHIFSHFCIGK